MNYDNELLLFLLFFGYRPIEDTIGALAELVKEGKIKYIGLSECAAGTLRRAYKVHPIAAVQVSIFEELFKKKNMYSFNNNSIIKHCVFFFKMEYSPWTLDIETNGIMEACRELGVTI